VSGMTYAKWNYGKTWQNTEFKADGTGSTRIYYLVGDNAIGYEKCDFHKLTGWGKWLNTNQQALDSNPQKGGGGKLE